MGNLEVHLRQRRRADGTAREGMTTEHFTKAVRNALFCAGVIVVMTASSMVPAATLLTGNASRSTGSLIEHTAVLSQEARSVRVSSAAGSFLFFLALIVLSTVGLSTARRTPAAFGAGTLCITIAARGTRVAVRGHHPIRAPSVCA